MLLWLENNYHIPELNMIINIFILLVGAFTAYKSTFKHLTVIWIEAHHNDGMMKIDKMRLCLSLGTKIFIFIVNRGALASI